MVVGGPTSPSHPKRTRICARRECEAQAAGQTQTKDFGTEAGATAHVDKLVAEKIADELVACTAATDTPHPAGRNGPNAPPSTSAKLAFPPPVPP